MSKAPSKRKRLKKLIPYARGFHPPSQQVKSRAVGFEINSVPQEYKDDGSSFLPIPRPTSQDDWLAQYVEKGQSYK